MNELEITGRVISVRPRLVGDFAILVGPPPTLYWFTAATPPHLGELIVATGYQLSEHEVNGGRTVVLGDAGFRVIVEPFMRRVVPQQWLERVTKVVRRPLMGYQIEGAGWIASRLAERKGAILSDEMGLGKSQQALAAVLAVQLLPCLIICPASVRRNWVDEIRAVSREAHEVSLVGRKQLVSNAPFVVLNYEALATRETELHQQGFKSLILDEAHMLKHATATGKHRAAVATRLSARIRRTTLLTGTPVPNRPDELWRLLHMADPIAWSSYKEYRRRYCTLREDDPDAVRTSTGVLSRVEEFHALVAPMFLRRLKAQTVELPPITRRIVRVELHPRDADVYEKARKDVAAWLNSIGRLTPARHNETLLRLNVLRKIAALSKLRSVVPNYISGWLKKVGRPLIIFGYHKSVVAGAARAARAAGAIVGVLNDKSKPDQRQDIVDAFSRGEFNVIVCSLLLAGVGLNLQHASDIVFLERLWVPTQMSQAEARAHRLGVKREVVCSYFDAVGTIDEHIAKVTRAKQVLIDYTVGDVEIERDVMMSVLQRLV